MPQAMKPCTVIVLDGWDDPVEEWRRVFPDTSYWPTQRCTPVLHPRRGMLDQGEDQVWEGGTGKAQGPQMPVKDRWHAPASGENPHLKNMGRLGLNACSPQMCSEMTRYGQTFFLMFSGPPMLVNWRCLDWDLDIHQRRT